MRSTVPSLPLIKTDVRTPRGRGGASFRGAHQGALTARTEASTTARSTERILTARDLKTVNNFISSNKNLHFTHRAGRVSDLIPSSTYLRAEGNRDELLHLSVAPLDPKRSALDTPLRFAPPHHFNCPRWVHHPAKAPRENHIMTLLKGPGHQPLDLQRADRQEKLVLAAVSADKARARERIFANKNLREFEVRAAAAHRARKPTQEATAHFAMATLYYNALNLENAISELAVALALFDDAADGQGVALCHNVLGYCYAYIGEHKMAVHHYKRQEQLSSAYGKCVAQINMGVAYAALGEVAYALDAFEDALPNAQTADDTMLESLALGNCGVVSLRVGDMRKAQTSLEQCLEHCSLAGDKVGATVCLLLLGQVYMQARDYQHALFYFEHGLRIGTESKNDDMAAVAKVSIGVARGAMTTQETMAGLAVKMGKEPSVRHFLPSTNTD